MCLSGVEQGDRTCGTIQGMEYLRGWESDFVFRLRAHVFTAYTAEGRPVRGKKRTAGI
jgi:hypothetical protein